MTSRVTTSKLHIHIYTRPKRLKTEKRNTARCNRFFVTQSVTPNHYMMQHFSHVSTRASSSSAPAWPTDEVSSSAVRGALSVEPQRSSPSVAPGNKEVQATPTGLVTPVTRHGQERRRGCCKETTGILTGILTSWDQLHVVRVQRDPTQTNYGYTAAPKGPHIRLVTRLVITWHKLLRRTVRTLGHNVHIRCREQEMRQ